MANTKISQLTLNTNPNGGEELVYAYNNTNGKMTLNTMKAFATANTQEELVSGTNIKTINGNSILGSGNLVISGGGGSGEDNDYDAIVDASGNGDYTSISDAITAGIKRMYVRNGSYTMSSQTLSTGDFKMVGESKEGVQINITYPTRSGTIFTTTSNTTDISHSFLISNVTFNITYTGNYGYFILFEIPDNGFLTLKDCNVCVVSADNGCNFYLCDSSGQMDVSSCYIEVYPATGNPQGVGFLGINSSSTCYDSTIVIDAAQSIGTTGLEFNGNALGNYVGCVFKIGQTHSTQGDVAILGAQTGFGCRYFSSTYANIRIYGRQTNCIIGQIGADANYDSDLNAAVTSKKISIWKPSTSYAVGDYVMSGKSNTLARCTTAHTSGASYDNTKFTDVYGDVYIQAGLSQCNLTVWGTVIISGVAPYNDTLVQPATAIGADNNIFFCTKPSSSLSVNYCNFILLSNRGFNYNAISGDDGTASTVNVYIGGESSTLCGNRIIANTGYIYSGGYGNIITNNIFTYITGNTTPTITQVTSGQSEIANNVIRGVADWNS